MLALDSIFDLRYRMLTRQNSFGFIGATILEIITDIQRRTGIYTWGFLAASLPHETSNYSNKRFNVYLEILRRSFFRKQRIFVIKDFSAIFVIPHTKIRNVDLIFNDYEQIFSETN
jgi:hypothetical protein